MAIIRCQRKQYVFYLKFYVFIFSWSNTNISIRKIVRISQFLIMGWNLFNKLTVAFSNHCSFRLYTCNIQQNRKMQHKGNAQYFHVGVNQYGIAVVLAIPENLTYNEFTCMEGYSTSKLMTKAFEWHRNEANKLSNFLACRKYKQVNWYRLNVVLVQQYGHYCVLFYAMAVTIQ